jgi:hypothetical protein
VTPEERAKRILWILKQELENLVEGTGTPEPCGCILNLEYPEKSKFCVEHSEPLPDIRNEKV